MSFSFDVKEELCKVREKDNICQAAELYGMVLLGQSVEEDNFKISTENVLVVNRLQSMTADLLGLFFEMTEVGVTFNASLSGSNLSKLYQMLRMKEESGISLEIKSHLLRSKDRFFAFLRGAVLAGGYLSDPFSGYHFELVTPYYAIAKSLLELMNNHGINCKMVVRRSNYVIYIKDSQQIYDLLYRLGARSSAFELMDVKIEKETNNNNNRVDNCAAYNMDKALNKAVEQIQAIETIENKGGLSALPEDLLYVAILRKENPTASLTELSNLSDGRISRAGLSRKLNKIIELAKK